MQAFIETKEAVGSPNGVDSSSFEKAAISIARTICRDAFWHGDVCNWMGMEHDHSSEGAPDLITTNLNASFYNGTSGVAYFLAKVYDLNNDAVVKKTALGAIRHALGQIDVCPPSAYLSMHNGLLGIAYVSLSLSEIFDDEKLRIKALQHLSEILNTKIAESTGLDVLEGCAGAVPVLLKLRGKVGEALITRIDDRLHELGEHILSTAQRTQNGMAWKPMHGDGQPLLGYAHGCAGFAHALMELFHHTGEQAYYKASHMGVTYENELYNSDEQNWPDLRTPEGAETGNTNFMNAWCHGAMGIGLSRLRCYEITGESLFLKDAELALAKVETSIDFTKTSSCACHGVAGNMELLMCAAEKLGSKDATHIARSVGQEAVSKVLHTGRNWINGLQNDCELPGFMNGLSGIGYFFLRLIDQKKYPSMLLIRPEDTL